MPLHDPCSMRSETEQQYAVRKLLRLCGTEVREVENSGGRTLCCGIFPYAVSMLPQWGDGLGERIYNDCSESWKNT